jgi:hypothetical protein
MPEPGDDGLDWDETVDVICVGGSPGVLAYAICCAANDLDVLVVRPPAEPDAETAAWIAAMTVDLAARLNPGRETGPDERPGFSLARVVPAPEPVGKRFTLETFFGEHLRQWSADCLHSPLGVMFTQVPDLLLPMRTEDDEAVTAAFIGANDNGELLTWLQERADELGVGEPENTMAAMRIENGRIAGVELEDGYLVAATGGLVFPVDPTTAVPDLPSTDGCEVAIVGRQAGRFARVDLLQR